MCFLRMKDHKIINDPVFGFIKVPRGLLLDIMSMPVFQRLTRIKQVGMASVVYPGAQHTRFQHSLGAYYLMSEAILSLQQKGIDITPEEEEAVEAAILLHDVGHGPFSHVLEHTLITDISHEDISLLIMEQMNRQLDGRLSLALSIFKDQYHKKFLHQLISSQLDMDRLDYLRRDSFFTGVTEGNIGSARIIKMLNVVDDRLIVESKGIYSIENYLTTRRLMYWQVYLHKTTVAMEKVLVNTLHRAKYLLSNGVKLFAPPALMFYLGREVDRHSFETDPDAMRYFSMLDDSDVWCAIKEWAHCDDTVLSMLAADLVYRIPFKVEVSDTPFSEERISLLLNTLSAATKVPYCDLNYLYSVSTIQKDMYDVNDDHIDILFKDGSIRDIAEASEILNVQLLSKKIRKYYLCYQRI